VNKDEQVDQQHQTGTRAAVAEQAQMTVGQLIGWATPSVLPVVARAKHRLARRCTPTTQDGADVD
jgi:hypothetical protein